MDQPASPPVETVVISRLFCSPANPRRNDAAVAHVAASLRRFGWQQPAHGGSLERWVPGGPGRCFNLLHPLEQHPAVGTHRVVGQFLARDELLARHFGHVPGARQRCSNSPPSSQRYVSLLPAPSIGLMMAG